jgi:vitamin B12/bleomycin/antimicrobial peptide transport system ATP-binding/permease protein
MSNGHQFRLRYIGGEHANEDGRISEDVRIVCEMILEFFVTFLYAITQLFLFTGVLWFNSGPLSIGVGTIVLTLPGHMVWVALLYASIGATITILVGHSLVRATDRRQAAEADLRAGLVNAITNAESIALARAERSERRRLSVAFDLICVAWAYQRKLLRNLIFFSAGYGQLTAVLPLLILAPRFVTGEMSLGDLMLVTLAFGQVTAALSWLSVNYSTLAQWEASAERVLGLHDALLSMDKGSAVEVPGTFTRSPENGPCLSFNELSLVSPAGELIVDRFTAEIKPGERVLIEATPDASEGLFRAVAGLSCWGAGRIELPDNCEPFFLGERPYVPHDTLLRVLVDPQDVDSVSANSVTQALVHVGLTRLVPLLQTAANWGAELGFEELQRLGFARAFIHKPRWILMHDATSALSRAVEEEILDHLIRALPETSIITITHRSIGERQFQRRIRVDGAA